MAIFNSWTGRQPSPAAPSAALPSPTSEVAVKEHPPQHPLAGSKIAPRVDRNLLREDHLAEYRRVAAEVGISDQDLLVEEFRYFLARHDIPTFAWGEVVKYMDEVAARDNPTKLGWHWCPVRPKDAEIPMRFGRSSKDHGQSNERHNVTASDYYESHNFNALKSTFTEDRLVTEQLDWRQHPSPAYSRTLPLHALKKIALIEKGFTAGPVVFLVTDYTIKPDIIVNPDPFLMAIIPNSAVSHGKGRFIIDVWDEPGFGLEQMLK